MRRLCPVPRPFCCFGLLVGLVACSDYGLAGKRDDNAGGPGTPAIAADPESLDLGLVCGVGDIPLTLRNVGDAPLTLTAILAPAGWEVQHAPLPLTLAPAESLAVQVQGSGPGELVIESDDPFTPTLTLPLDATADQPPRISLLSPQADTVLGGGASTVFEVQVSDDLDSPEALDLRWLSSVDGELGGDPPDASGLGALVWDGNIRTPGPQTLTATVTDSCGNAVSTSLSFCQEEGYDADGLDLDTWNFEGSARYDEVNGWVELTSATEWQAGTAFQTAAQVPGNDVVIAFSFFVGDRSGADGISLTALDADRMTGFVGDAGGGIGYAGLPGWSIEVDTFFNRYDPTEADHLSLHFDGDVLNPVAVAELPEVEDGAWHEMTVVVRGQDMTVTVDGVVYLDLSASQLSAFPAYIGFTGATGASYNAHRIDGLVVEGSMCADYPAR